MPLEAKVVVAGAGPGGTIAAYCLAQKGIPVTLLDKASFPRDKICGDALSGKVVEVLKKVNPEWLDDFRLSPTQIGSYGVIFKAPNGKELKVPFKQAFTMEDPAPGFICKRFDFDYFLLEKAIAHPLVSFVSGFDITKYERIGNQLKIVSKTGDSILSDYVIGAEGAHSKLAKFHGFSMESRHYCAGVRAYYSGVSGLDKENFIELQFLENILPGYFWIFPLPNGMANVGIGIRSDVISKKNINLKETLESLLRNEPQLRARFSNATIEGRVVGFGLPLGSKKRVISGDNYVLTGDAASLIDPFTGEGIGNAMVSGMFAAESIANAVAASRTDAGFLKAYDEKVYNRLWDELKLSYRMQHLVQYPRLFNFVVNKAISNQTLRETISCMFEDIDLRQQFRKPSFYWKLIWG